MNARLTVLDAASKTGTIRLGGLDPAMTTPGTKLSTFVDALQVYLNGGIIEYAALIPDKAALEAPNTTAVDAELTSSLHKGLCTFQFTTPVGEEHYTNIWIPAPNVDTNFELRTNIGYRMTAARGAALLAALNTASDQTYRFRQGKLEYKSGRSGKPGKGGYMVLTDTHGRPQYVPVPEVSDKAKLKVFAETLCTGVAGTTFSNCGCSEVVVITEDGGTKSVTASVEKPFDSINHRAILNFSWALSSKLYLARLTLPTLKGAHLDDPSGSDATIRTVKSATGAAIAADLTTLYGSAVRDFSFINGFCDMSNLD